MKIVLMMLSHEEESGTLQNNFMPLSIGVIAEFLRLNFDKEHLDSLRKFAKVYFHGHSVGGTNPALLEAMAAKAFIFAHNNVFNRDVLEDNAFFFKNSNEVQHLLNCLKDIEKSKKQKISNNSIKIDNEYSHQNITNQYINLIEKISR